MKKITSGFLLFFFPKINTPKWRVGVKDAIQAVLKASLADCITIIIQSLQSEKIVLDWHALSVVFATSALTYILYAWFNGGKQNS